MILSNVDTLQSTPKLDKSQILSNLSSARPTRDGSGPSRWNDPSLLKLPNTMPTLMALYPLWNSLTLVPHSSFNILTCKNTSPNVNNFSVNLKSSSFSFSHPPPNSNCHFMLRAYYGENYNSFYFSACVTLAQHRPHFPYPFVAYKS